MLIVSMFLFKQGKYSNMLPLLLRLIDFLSEISPISEEMASGEHIYQMDIMAYIRTLFVVVMEVWTIQN